MLRSVAPSTLQIVTAMPRVPSYSASLTRPMEMSLLVSPGAKVTAPPVMVSHSVAPSIENPIVVDTLRLPDRTRWITYAPAASDTYDESGVAKPTQDGGSIKTGAEKTRSRNVCVSRRATTSNPPRGNVWVTRAEPVTLT